MHTHSQIRGGFIWLKSVFIDLFIFVLQEGV